MNVRSVLFVIPFLFIFQSRTIWGQEVVDATTLDQKIMAGYQGWFNASGDGSGYGWIHWSRSGAMPAADNITFDMWPDMREYEEDELFETRFIYPDLSNAGLYSAYTPRTVDRHVKWMKDYGIDGVFVQRFISSALSRGDLRDSVLQNVRRAAEKHGRVFANMYDLSGGKETMVEDVKNDWMHLVDDLHILGSPNYLHHNGRPVLSIWGFNVGGSRGVLTAGMAAEMVRWFTEDAPEKYRVTLKGGVNDDWRTQSSEWQSVYDELDIISPWAVGRYGSESGADNYRTNNIEPDLISAEGRGSDYMPVVFPGFSWFNLKGEKFNHIKRNGGGFFWRQIYNAVDAGCDMVYVAMYDEVDEGTAIYKLAENAGQTPTTGRFVTLDIDGFKVPSDWYLRLTGAGTRMLRGEIPVSSSIPIDPYPDDAAFDSQEAPTVMAPASATFVELSFMNTGTTVWSGGDQYRLRFTGSPDSLLWGSEPLILESGESIAPGQKKTFFFEINAPAEESVYPFQWQMARDSLGNFGESSTLRYIEIGNSIRYLDDCDALSDWEPALNLSLNNTDQKQGGGCIEYTGASEGQPEFWKVFPEAYASGIPVQDGILQFWYFVSGVTLLGPEPMVQLGSGGEKDLNVFYWSLSDLNDGWNLVSLEFEEALISGSPDAEALNWFCLSAGQDASLTTRIDEIRVFDRFDGAPRYNLVVNSGSGSGQYVEDAILTIQAEEAPAAQEFISWSIDSGEPLIEDINAQTTSLRMPAGDVEISARYKLLGIYLDDCDLLKDWGSSADLSLNTTDQQEGLGCIEFTGSSTDEFKKAFSTPYNSGTTAESGKLQFWYFVSDPSLLENSNQVELGSAGRNDQSEYNWKIGSLSPGWNFISLDFASAGVTGGVPDLSAINWFRVYHFKSGSVTTRIDAIEIVDPNAGERYPLTVFSGAGDGNFYAGMEVSIQADPAPEGMVFDAWVIEAGEPEIANRLLASTTLVMPAGQVIVSASYKSARKYTLTVNGGTGSGEYDPGETVMISANAGPEGQIFQEWIIEQGNPEISNLNASVANLTMPSEDVVVSARYVDPSLSAKDPLAEATLRIYPNPTQAYLTVGFLSETASKVDIRLYGMSGVEVARLIQGAPVMNSTFAVDLKVSEFNVGMYLLRIQTDQWVAIRKIVVW